MKNPRRIVTVRPTNPFVWKPDYAILLDAEPERAKDFALQHPLCYVFVFVFLTRLEDIPDYSVLKGDPAATRILSPLYIGNFEQSSMSMVIDQYICRWFEKVQDGVQPQCILDERATSTVFKP